MRHAWHGRTARPQAAAVSPDAEGFVHCRGQHVASGHYWGWALSGTKIARDGRKAIINRSSSASAGRVDHGWICCLFPGTIGARTGSGSCCPFLLRVVDRGMVQRPGPLCGTLLARNGCIGRRRCFQETCLDSFCLSQCRIIAFTDEQESQPCAVFRAARVGKGHGTTLA
jgi:hypothetical protein